MRRGPIAVAGLAAVSCFLAAGTAAAVTGTRAPASGGAWGRAVEVPGTAALNSGGNAQVRSFSCASDGNCAVGGYYLDGSHHFEAFVASQIHDRWHPASEVPGTAALNSGGDASTLSLSCPSAGNCAGGGFYRDGAIRTQAFVVTQKKGQWGKAIEVPGTAALNVAGSAVTASVSCASAGNCGAGGNYTDRSGHSQPFLVSERKGRWGKAIEIPRLASLNVGGDAVVSKVSCPAIGSCSATGFYDDKSGHFQVFVVSQRNGKWGKAAEFPGSGQLNAGGVASILALSCPSAGNCAAGGAYTDHDGNVQAFVATERNGTWGKALKAPGLSKLNAGGNAQIRSLSCPSAGNCAAAGLYKDGLGRDQALLVSQIHGRWRPAFEIPGTAALNAGGDASAFGVSCSSAGNCAAGGTYLDRVSACQAFIVTQRNGHWSKAFEVPGTAGLNGGGGAEIFALSCTSAGECGAAGFYREVAARFEVFVITQT